jgi:tRNA (cmo5U34)-methyltransferase
MAGAAKTVAVGDSISTENGRWTFGGSVSQTFDSHVEKSVPLYREGHDLIAKLSDFFVQDDSVCYEIGCSTGELLKAVAARNEGKKARFVGIDPVEAMIQKAKEKYGSMSNMEFQVGDARDFDYEPADMIMSYYTLQFVRPKFRQQLVDKIYQSLNWGGAFMLFEKVRGPDARFQDILTALYYDYKIDRGYDYEEILGKTRSLKGVLEPFTTQANIDIMKRAGFVDIMPIMKYTCFEGYLAIK